MIHTDHLGGSNIITDGQGNIVQQVQYTPYGKISYELNLGVSVNYLYTGQQLDRETGLYYYNARYYDPDIGRFIQPDTIIPGPANSQTYNRYSYCLNNPVMMTDPSGHEPAMSGHEYQELIQKEYGYDIPDLAGMPDDNAQRFEWLYQYLSSGRQVSNELQAEIQRQGITSVDNLWSHYIHDTQTDSEDDGMVLASQVVGAVCAGIGACFGPIGIIIGSAVGSMAATYMCGGSTGDVLYAGMVGAVSGACIAYGGPAGPAIGGAFSGAAYSARYGGNMGEAALKGAAISQVGSYFGGKAKANGLGSVGQAAASGASSGAAGAALNGGNIGEAMLKGAAIGAMTAVVIQTVQKFQGNPANPTDIEQEQTSWFKPKNEEFSMGRKGMPLFNSKNPIMNFLESVVPGAHEFAQMHDSFVGGMPKTGIGWTDVIIDLVINIPSMPAAYVASVIDNTLNTTVNIVGAINPRNY